MRSSSSIACRLALGVAALGCLLAAASRAQGEPATVLYLDRSERVERTLPDPTDLWIPGSELERVNGFVLKPEGACLDDLCVPVNAKGDDPVLARTGGETWFSLTAFARKLDQGFVVDPQRRVWSFSPIPVAQAPYFSQALAPDFEMPDREGRPVRLSELRGKKVLLLTWASW
ncbi:MAG TPA: hypothetical protein VMV46_12675 [Thermoanaerobaculia bacterium]|nr:hypothetical protein [Thermoanaerobaculia bacterium]